MATNKEENKVYPFEEIKVVIKQKEGGSECEVVMKNGNQETVISSKKWQIDFSQSKGLQPGSTITIATGAGTLTPENTVNLDSFTITPATEEDDAEPYLPFGKEPVEDEEAIVARNTKNFFGFGDRAKHQKLPDPFEGFKDYRDDLTLAPGKLGFNNPDNFAGIYKGPESSFTANPYLFDFPRFDGRAGADKIDYMAGLTRLERDYVMKLADLEREYSRQKDDARREFEAKRRAFMDNLDRGSL